MGYTYGIKNAREAVRKMISNEPLEDRLRGAWIELDCLEKEDVSEGDFKLIQDWKTRYLSRNSVGVTEEGELESGNTSQALQELAVDLVWLAVSIHVHNEKLEK